MKNNSNTKAILISLILTILLTFGAGFFVLSKIRSMFEEKPAQVVYVDRYENNNNNGVQEETKELDDSDFNIGRRYSDVFVQGNDLKDNYGNIYSNAYKIIASDKTMSISLDGKYRYLKGDFALSYEDGDEDFNYARVYVYDEDGNKIYVSRDISQNDPEPIRMLVDVSGCKRIRVEIEGYDRYVIPVTLISSGLYLSNDSGI